MIFVTAVGERVTFRREHNGRSEEVTFKVLGYPRMCINEPLTEGSTYTFDMRWEDETDLEMFRPAWLSLVKKEWPKPFPFFYRITLAPKPVRSITGSEDSETVVIWNNDTQIIIPGCLVAVETDARPDEYVIWARAENARAVLDTLMTSGLFTFLEMRSTYTVDPSIRDPSMWDVGHGVFESVQIHIKWSTQR